MRAVRTDRKLELHQELVGGWPVAIRRVTVLTAQLAEFAGVVGQQERLAAIEQRRIIGVVGLIEASAHPPAPRELIVARHVEAAGPLQAVELIALALNELGPRHELVIDRASQWPPPERRIEPEQLRREAT